MVVVAAVMAAAWGQVNIAGETVRSRMITTQGEVSRTGEASDGEAASALGLAVRGPGKMLLSSAVFGFQSEAKRAWTLHVDSEASVSGQEADRIAYHIEVSHDGGKTWQSLRNDKAPFQRLDMRFDLGEHPAADLRAKVTLYFLKDGKAAGAMNLFEVFLTD